MSAFPAETLDGVRVLNPDATAFLNVSDKYRRRGFDVIEEKTTNEYALIVTNPLLHLFLICSEFLRDSWSGHNSMVSSHATSYEDVFVNHSRPVGRSRGYLWRWVDWM